MKLLKFWLLAAIALAVSACQYDSAALDDGYDVGDISVIYCSSSTEAERDAYRGIVNLGLSKVGLSYSADYCSIFEGLPSDYDVGDISRAWCSASDEHKRVISKVFDKRLKFAAVSLDAVVCADLKQKPLPQMTSGVDYTSEDVVGDPDDPE